MSPLDLPEEMVAITDLVPHSRNYREHPQDQLGHIKASISKHGMYRNVVIARDNTIFAGHGVVEAARQMGLDTVPARRVDIDSDSVQALEILAGDNEIDHLGVVDDRRLTELLKEIKDTDPDGLFGTGYDEMMLANLAFVTRPKSEIKDFDEAAEWVGLPEYEREPDPIELTVKFEMDADRDAFAQLVGVKLTQNTKSMWYPPRERDDMRSVRLVESA